MVSVGALAQYPKLTKEDVAREERVKRIAEAHSDSAWEVAWPTIEKESREGRPYIPSARRPTDLPQAAIPSVPGAEGGGMYSFGGRGGKVLTVTNLNDDGPGSLRWACEQGGARIIVFNVSGTIRIKTPIIIRAPYVTIAGQTAPGDGVQVTGETIWVNTHDVVVRHMRFRRGETDVARRDDTFGGNPVGNIMLDHLSCEYGLDENISFYRHMFRPGPTYPEEKRRALTSSTMRSARHWEARTARSSGTCGHRTRDAIRASDGTAFSTSATTSYSTGYTGRWTEETGRRCITSITTTSSQVRQRLRRDQ